MKKNKQLKKAPPLNHNRYWIYGKHPVISAINNPRRNIFKIITTGDVLSKDILTVIKNRKIALETASKTDIDSFLPNGSVHQGIVAEVAFLDNFAIEDFCSNDEPQLLIILDQVTDPHNIGAIMRSAVAFNATAIIVPDKNTCQETSVLAKSASGALDIIPIVRISNLVSAINILKKNDFWIIGLDGEAEKELSQIEHFNKTALVLGSEGDGIRRLILENCDFITKLPISNKIESLNVSNATAIALYELRSK